jgi:hypothetical protein
VIRSQKIPVQRRLDKKDLHRRGIYSRSRRNSL